MHYKNGREAKNGDKIIWIPKWEQNNGDVVYGSPVSGILYDAVAGNDYCNGKIALTSSTDSCPNLKECLHIEDVCTIEEVCEELKNIKQETP